MAATTLHHSVASEIYDPDDVGLRDSPPMKPLRPKLHPSPSPPPTIPLAQVRPSQGDAVLIAFLDNGRHPEIAMTAGSQPLPSASSVEESDDDSLHEATSYRSMSSDAPPIAPALDSAVDLKTFAATALALQVTSPGEDGETSPTESVLRQGRDFESSPTRSGGGREAIIWDGRALVADRRSAASGHPRHPDAVMPATPLSASSSGGLPPLQMDSPLSDGAGQMPLPSISVLQLGDIKRHPGAGGVSADQHSSGRHGLAYTTTSPRMLPIMSPPGGLAGSQVSPPISPNEAYRREPPSPAQSLPGLSPFFYPQNGASHRSLGGYSSGTADSLSMDHAVSTPGTSVAERMSIDGLSNPLSGAYVCREEGCTAAPFQTQYLLNSHANVHSSARPHYCPVQGCPRAEGGKGFKRKNEMIRHGLVHESPGYVCPFCPDREHKYPRPDNLQRHVRVHHVDKDKDDPLLRDVLSQRPDGPNRGRRRRIGTS